MQLHTQKQNNPSSTMFDWEGGGGLTGRCQGQVQREYGGVHGGAIGEMQKQDVPSSTMHD